MYKMIVIIVQNYTDAKVHTITVGNRKLFWVRMIDVKNRLDKNNTFDAVRKLKILQKSKLENINVLKKKKIKSLILVLVILWKK